MPFKDTNEGTTHSYNDGCGIPEHNDPMPQHPEKEPCEWRCGRCDGADVPMHSRHCSKRNEWEKLYFCEYSDIDAFKKDFDSVVESLLQNQAQEIEEKVEKEIDFIEEGIQACKDDSAEEDCSGNELHYIFGKSQALKIIKARLQYTLLAIKQVTNK